MDSKENRSKWRRVHILYEYFCQHLRTAVETNTTRSSIFLLYSIIMANLPLETSQRGEEEAVQFICSLKNYQFIICTTGRPADLLESILTEMITSLIHTISSNSGYLIAAVAHFIYSPQRIFLNHDQ